MGDRVETWEVNDGRRTRRLSSRQVVERLVTGQLSGAELARKEGAVGFTPLAQTELYPLAHPSGDPRTNLLLRRVAPMVAAAVAVLMTSAMTDGLRVGGWGLWALFGIAMWALSEGRRLAALWTLPRASAPATRAEEAPATEAAPDELTLARRTVLAIDARLGELAEVVAGTDEVALRARIDGADVELASALQARLDAAQAARDAHAELLRQREILALELDAAASHVAVARAREGGDAGLERLREVRRRAAAQVEVGRRR